MFGEMSLPFGEENGDVDGSGRRNGTFLVPMRKCSGNGKFMILQVARDVYITLAKEYLIF